MSRFSPAGSRGTRCASLCAVAICLIVPTAAVSSLHRRLVDGSASPAVPAVLRSHPGLTTTRARLRTVASVHRLLSSCPEARQARGRIVERIGVRGRSVTFVVRRTVLVACDLSPDARSSYGPWCGTSGWNLVRHQVSDPRLDLCYDRKGRPLIAFGWINPLPRAKWIVIEQPGDREVYPVAAGLPVRVSTVSGLEQTGGAVFRMAQYDVAGVLLVRRRVVATIAS
jgi:hypothetical protein